MDKYELYSKQFRYLNIENSVWYKELITNCLSIKREDNKIQILFTTKELAETCVAKANARNISNIGPYDCCYPIKGYGVDIYMNWKEDRPTRISRKSPLILD